MWLFIVLSQYFPHHHHWSSPDLMTISFLKIFFSSLWALLSNMLISKCYHQGLVGSRVSLLCTNSDIFSFFSVWMLSPESIYSYLLNLSLFSSSSSLMLTCILLFPFHTCMMHDPLFKEILFYCSCLGKIIYYQDILTFCWVVAKFSNRTIGRIRLSKNKFL